MPETTNGYLSISLPFFLVIYDGSSWRFNEYKYNLSFQNLIQLKFVTERGEKVSRAALYKRRAFRKCFMRVSGCRRNLVTKIWFGQDKKSRKNHGKNHVAKIERHLHVFVCVRASVFRKVFRFIQEFAKKAKSRLPRLWFFSSNV